MEVGNPVVTREIKLSPEARAGLDQLANASMAANRDLSVAFAILVRQVAGGVHPNTQFKGITTDGMLIEEPGSGD